MKIRMDFGKAIPVRPSFDVLRAMAEAAQAATPTAQASAAATPEEHGQALARLFGADGPDLGTARLGCFNPELGTRTGRERQR